MSQVVWILLTRCGYPREMSRTSMCLVFWREVRAVINRVNITWVPQTPPSLKRLVHLFQSILNMCTFIFWNYQASLKFFFFQIFGDQNLRVEEFHEAFLTQPAFVECVYISWSGWYSISMFKQIFLKKIKI